MLFATAHRHTYSIHFAFYKHCFIDYNIYAIPIVIYAEDTLGADFTVNNPKIDAYMKGKDVVRMIMAAVTLVL